jgi:protease II
MFVVIDGQEGKAYDYVGSLTLSPNGKRIAYIAGTGRKRFVVVDGQEGKEYFDVISIAFSPDSRRVAYIAAATRKNRFIVVDEQEGKPYPDIEWDSIVFSPNSKCLAYIVSTGNKMFVVVDGVEGNHYDSVVTGKNGGKIVFDGNDSVKYLALKKYKIYLIKRNLSK